MPTDSALILRLKNKEELALSMLYDKYSAAIYGVILRMIKQEELAQDLLQETFLTVWNQSYRYDDTKGSFYTWVYRIARNKTLNQIRSQKNIIQTEDLSVYIDKKEEENDLLDFSKLNGSIEKLEPHHRKAIDLVYFKGYTHREAYKEMEVPLGTFKSYVRQALKVLKEKHNFLIAIFYSIFNAL
jgi:RNA polymerase sigma-70 factor (ECF subfamily)